MNSASVFRAPGARRLPLVACAFLLLLAPGGAAAATPDDEELSPRLAELAERQVRTASQAEQAALLSLPTSGAGSLLRDGNRVLVDVRFDNGALARVDELRDAGAEIVHASRRYQTVAVAAKPADLPAIGSVTGVANVNEVLTPMVLGADCGGLVRSEGDAHLLAPSARARIGVDGTGIKVGILSDSFDRRASAATRAAGDVASGDLPGPGSPCGSTAPVGVLSDPFAGTDEGRAMAQIVHDVAPGATIDFATAFATELAFAANIKALAAAGSRVIVDDVVYFEEPFFQDGPVAVAVDEVSAAGVAYFSAAGNENLISEGKNVSSYEAPFRNSGTCPPTVPESECTDFDPGVGVDNSYDLEIPGKSELKMILQWAEPRNGVQTDLDAYLLSEGGSLLPRLLTPNLGTQRPFESFAVTNLGFTPTTVHLAIGRSAGVDPAPVLKFVELGSARPTSAQYAISSKGDTIGPTIFGHSGASGAISVAAVPFSSTTAPETFSSRGPVKHYFGPVLGASPAPPLAVPELIAKPDLAATDGVRTTFFSPSQPSGPFFRFFGTSAAAPHAAAVAALALQANPGATPAQIRSALTSTARPVGAFGPDAVGAGLIDAGAAVDRLALSPLVSLTKAPAKLSRVRRPTIEFSANRPASFSCSIDGVVLPCVSPFTWPQALRDGRHTVLVSATDLSGRVGASAPAGFKVDTRRPRTRIVKHPPKQIVSNGRARASFRFRSNEGGKSFLCKVDRAAYMKCGKKLVRSFPLGAHTLRVKARDRAGNIDATPATFRFQVVLPG